MTYFELFQALPETRFTFYGPKALEIHVVPTKTATEFYQVKFLYTISINSIANSRTSFTIYLGVLQKEVGVLLTPPSGKDQIQEWKGLQSHRLLRIEFNDPKR